MDSLDWYERGTVGWFGVTKMSAAFSSNGKFVLSEADIPEVTLNGKECTVHAQLRVTTMV